jgi:hypothetical protein
MLSVQLVARLLPHAETSANIHRLLEECDRHGPAHCALGIVWRSTTGLSWCLCIHVVPGSWTNQLLRHQTLNVGFTGV